MEMGEAKELNHGKGKRGGFQVFFVQDSPNL